MRSYPLRNRAAIATSPDKPSKAHGSPSTLVEVATSTLREEILTSRIAPGSRIPLVKTASRLTMSLIPLREALRNLAVEGLVDPLPQRGFRVRSLSLADMDDLYRVREVIEAMAIRMAVPKLDEHSLQEAETAYRDILDAVYSGRQHLLWTSHHAFHFAIYGQCGSPWLLRISEQLWTQSERYHRLAILYDPERATEHEQILRACRRQDPDEAARILVGHLKRSHKRVRKAIAPQLGVVSAAKPARARKRRPDQRGSDDDR